MAISRQVRRSLALGLTGLLGGLGLVLALFGGGEVLRRMSPRQAAEAPPETAAGMPPPASPPATAPGIAGAPGTREGGTAREGGPAGTGAPRTAAPGGKPAPAAPSFDIVRVEPNGDAVVAGRGAPNSVVEMLVDGRPVARALSDPNGQFAIVPPALPAGSSEIQLRTRAADGQESRSAQTVAVEVARGRDRKPLVALTAPDKPTVVLSQPDAPAALADVRPPAAARPAEAPRPEGGRPETATARPVRIVSVDAQEGGRLYVTAAGTPGADLRLYLNDTLIAPGSVGPDGTVVFTIGRGVKPGSYRVRVDQVEAGTAKVRGRAEVPFTVPEPARVAAREAPAPAPQPPVRPEAAGGAGGGAGGPAGTPGARDGADGRTARPGPAPGRAEPGAAGSAPHPQPGAQAGRAQEGAQAQRSAEMQRGSDVQQGAKSQQGAPPTGASGPGPRPADPAGPEEAQAGGAPGTQAAATAPGPSRAGAVFVPEISTARISRGDNLWRISQRTYGRGERYTVIYDANQDQIRDPDLIYPGQIFVLPGDKRG